MTVTGIICEYNPFHNGHKYMLGKAREISSADFLIAVISGNFVQRGEPAFFSKESRVRAALSEGFDMVLELPFSYACASAQYFSEGAVSVLNSLGCVNYIAFGSESGDLNKLTLAVDNFTKNQQKIKALLKAGISYPKAVEKLTGIENGQPNDMLGIEYIKALRKFNSKITPLPVLRFSGENILSASSIRENVFSMLNSNKINEILPFLQKYIPEKSFEILKEEIKQGNGPVFFESMEQIIFSKLRSCGPDFIKNLPGVSEGLENKIYESALDCCSLRSLVENCVSKRYTASRIKRILINSAVLTFKNEENNFTKTVSDVKLPYVRILGMKKEAAPLSSYIKEHASVPVVMSLADCNKIAPDLARLEATASDIYNLFTPCGIRPGRREYCSKFIII